MLGLKKLDENKAEQIGMGKVLGTDQDTSRVVEPALRIL